MTFLLKTGIAAVCAVLLTPEVSAASIFVTSRDGGGADLYQFSANGTLMTTLPGNGLKNGQGVTIGPNGNLFVASEGGNAVLQYNPVTGAFINSFAVTANSPGPIAFGPDGNLYVGVGGIVQQFDGATGGFLSTFASGQSMSSAAGIVFDSNGNLYVSDGVTGTINRFDSTGAFVSTFVSGNPLLAKGAGPLLFNGTTLLVAATFGNGQTWGNSILAFDPTGASLGNFISDANLIGPSGMAFGPDGNFYVVNYAGGNVVRYTSGGTFIDTFIANNPPSGRFIAFAPDDPGNGVPEPGSLGMVGIGLIGVLCLLKRR